jgi:hypothetical protein
MVLAAAIYIILRISKVINYKAQGTRYKAQGTRHKMRESGNGFGAFKFRTILFLESCALFLTSLPFIKSPFLFDSIALNSESFITQGSRRKII